MGLGMGVTFGGGLSWAQQMAALGATMGVNFATGETLGITLGDITATRASGGTALDLAGNVVSFGNNVLRRTNRGLLVEAAATNLVLQSQALGTTPWVLFSSGTASTAVVTNNFGTAPDGTMTATRIQLSLNGGTTSGDRATVTQNITIANAVQYTRSAWIRSLGGNVNCSWGSDLIASNQPLAVTSQWQRFQFTGTSSGTASNALIQLRGGQSPVNADAADILVWGEQLETGASATSYIATGAAPVSRAFDNIFAPLGPWWNANEGVFLGTVRDILAAPSARVLVGLNNNGTPALGTTFFVRTNSLTQVQAGGHFSTIALPGLTSLTRRRFAGGYRISDARQSVSADGLNFATNTTGDYASTSTNRMQLGAVSSAGSEAFGSYLENIAFIPTAGLLASGTTMNPLTVLT